jgi:hypothetical protein
MALVVCTCGRPEEALCGLPVQITGTDGEVLNHARMNGALAPISRFRRAHPAGSVAIPDCHMEFPASAGQVARQVATELTGESTPTGESKRIERAEPPDH